MNGELQHLMQVSASGNVFLRGKETVEPSMFKDDHYKVLFISQQQRNGIIKRFLKGPSELNFVDWLTDLRVRKCLGIALTNSNKLQDERVTTAFVGGGRRWGVVCLFKDSSELWVPQWALVNKSPNTIWSYTKVGDIAFLLGPIDLSGLLTRLRTALTDIGNLAQEIGEQFWKGNFFDKGLAILDDTLNEDHSWLPEIYSLEARKLVSAVEKSWVFGGMGSWNDSPPYSASQYGKEQEFEDMSNCLYEVIMDCIEGAMNSVVTA